MAQWKDQEFDPVLPSEGTPGDGAVSDQVDLDELPVRSQKNKRTGFMGLPWWLWGTFGGVTLIGGLGGAFMIVERPNHESMTGPMNQQSYHGQPTQYGVLPGPENTKQAIDLPPVSAPVVKPAVTPAIPPQAPVVSAVVSPVVSTATSPAISATASPTGSASVSTGIVQPETADTTSSPSVPAEQDVPQAAPDNAAQRTALLAEIKDQKARIAVLERQLQQRLQQEKPHVVVRTIVRDVPVQEHPSAWSGWSVRGFGNGQAFVAGPDGKVKEVRRGDMLDGYLVMSVSDGVVRTTNGVIR